MNLRHSIRHQLLMGIAVIVVPAGALAKTEVIPSASVSIGAGFSRNPFLSALGDNSTATGSIDVAPSLEFIDATTDAVLSADYNRTEYLSKFPGTDAYRLSVSGSHRFDPHFSLNLGIAFESAILGTSASNFVSPLTTFPTETGAPISALPNVVAPLVPTSTPIVSIPAVGLIGGDFGLVGLRQRREQLSVSASLDFQTTARSTWTVGVSASRAKYPGAGLLANDYKSYGVNLGYTRQLSASRTIGFSVAASSVDYAGRPTSRVYTPRITYTQQLSPRWSLRAAAGLGLVDNGFGTDVSGLFELGFCRRGERGQFCFSGSQQPSVNGFGGTRTQTAASVSYNYRFSERTVAAASISYSRLAGNSVAAVGAVPANNSQDYVSTELSLNRRIMRQMYVFGAVSYRDIYGLDRAVSADLAARVGISLALGGRR